MLLHSWIVAAILHPHLHLLLLHLLLLHLLLLLLQMSLRGGCLKASSIVHPFALSSAIAR